MNLQSIALGLAIALGTAALAKATGIMPLKISADVMATVGVICAVLSRK